MYVRRASFVLALALAALPAGRAAAAQPTSAAGPNRWAMLLGIEDGPGDTGFQLRGDMEFAQRPLSPQIGFSIVGSVGYSRFGDSYNDYFYGESVNWSLNLFKVIPAARFTFGHGTIRAYADAGLGLYYGWTNYEYRDLVTGYSYGVDDSSISLMMRFAGGVTFQVSPSFALGAELGFNPYFGDIPDDTFTSLLLSATFRM